jgi:hypothetical protein
LFLVVGFKSWFEFKVVCSLIGLEERFGNVKEKEKKKENNQTAAAQPAAAHFSPPQPRRSPAHSPSGPATQSRAPAGS